MELKLMKLKAENNRHNERHYHISLWKDQRSVKLIKSARLIKREIQEISNPCEKLILVVIYSDDPMGIKGIITPCCKQLDVHKFDNLNNWI